MKWNAFIERLRSELPGYASEVDADAIWKGIEPAVDKINSRNKRRPFWLPLLLLAGLLTIGGAAYLVLTDNPGDQLQGVVTDTSGTGDALTGKNQGPGHPDSRADYQNPDQGDAHTESEAYSASSGKEAANTVETDIDRQYDRTGLKDRKRADKSVSSVDYSAVTKIRDRKAGGEAASADIDQADINPGETSGSGTSAANLTTYRPVHEVYLEAGGHPGTGDEKAATADGSAGEYGLPVLTASVSTTTAMLMQAYSRVETGKSLEVVNTYERKARPSTDCPEFGRAPGLSFLVGVHGGVAYPFRKMTSSPDGESLMSLREDSEKSLVSGNMGVDFTMRHKSGIEIGTGLQYHTLLERLDLMRTVETTEIEYGVQAISINPMGDTVYIMGDVPVTTTTTERKRFYNRYRFIEIPVMFGYSAVVKNLRIGGEAGIIAGILTKTDGMILDADEMFTELNADNAAVSGSKFAMSYYFGASVSYLYESGVELGFHPHLRFMPTDFGAAGYPVRSKYFMVGGNVSIRYRFGK